MKWKSLNLNVDKAYSLLDKLTNSLSQNYGVQVVTDKHLPSGEGMTYDGFNCDMHVRIGSQMRIRGNLFERVDDVDFLKCICAIRHEEQHLIQNGKYYQNKNPNESIIQMATRKVASGENRTYYSAPERYNNDLSEINAEYIALIKTHRFIQTNFKHADADALMLRLINDKSKSTDGNRYYITGPFDSFDNALQAFRQHYEQAKTAKVAYTIPELRLSQEVNSTKDECVRFLQTCVRNDSADRELLTQFNQTKTAPEKDLMIASITQHLHPDIDFKRMYPCLETVDLEPEIVFGRQLQTCLQVHESDEEKELFEERVTKAKDIGERIKAAELKAQVQKEDAQTLNESLLTELQVDKIHTYEP